MSISSGTARKTPRWLFRPYPVRTIVGMDRNIALWIAYDGTDFHGWQRQPGQRTVQEVLEEALRRVTRHPINLEGSGRTDAGVHAAGQVAHFMTTRDLPVDRLAHAIGSRLPGDVSIVSLREVHPLFHSRAGALSKLYRYRIHNAHHRPVDRLAQRYTHHVWHTLDVHRMSQAARHFVGEHDFAAVAANTAAKASTVRTVLRCTVQRHLDEIWIDVEGTGFLYNQVRAMTGTLLDVGVGRFNPDDVASILESRDRANAGPTAPARGLCLRWVRYPPHLLKPPPTGVAERAGSPPMTVAQRDETP